MADTCRKIYVTAIMVLQWISLSISIMAPEYFYSVVPVSQSESLTNKFCHKFILLVVRASFDQVWVFEISGVKMLFNILIDSSIFFQVSFDVAWSPDCIDGRCYDAEALSKVVDFLVVMAYDEQSQIKTADCVAKANSPLKQTKAGKACEFIFNSVLTYISFLYIILN